MRLKIAVFVSGRGSNLEAIIEAIEAGAVGATIVTVVCNSPDAYAVTLAKAHGLDVFVLSHKGMSREAHEAKILEHLKSRDVEFVVLAGYMRVLTGKFLAAFKDPAGYNRVVNIHPTLLPAFKGANGYEDAFAYGVKVSGITIHLVDEQVDHGPILAQRAFPRLADDTLHSFRERGLAVEHALYPEVLAAIANGGVASLLLKDGHGHIEAVARSEK
ncbi:MAG: phosphoribosylglycinamide formyltransferase [Cyanobacteria bacterium SZAS LIN-2]|nr:phosphoribosylglycinamide formyltransferase [Cyanobacteria bacterium SZAS LIN-2]